jgi:hypothetical protein
MARRYFQRVAILPVGATPGTIDPIGKKANELYSENDLVQVICQAVKLLDHGRFRFHYQGAKLRLLRQLSQN